MLVHKVKGAIRIAYVDRAAAKLGLAPGLALADAHARYPALEAAAADPVGDGALMDHLLVLAERFTPLVAADPPFGLLLDVTGCAHLFGGEVQLRTRVRARFARLGLTVRAAIAGTPDAARACARFGRVGVVPPGEEAEHVRLLPVAALGADAATVLALARAGLKRVGDLADRPSAALTARFGEGLTRALRRVLGREDARLVTVRRAADVAVERQFAEPIAHMDAVEAVLGELVAQAAVALAESGAGGRRFEARFFRSDGAVRAVTVETSRPVRDAAPVMRLFAERLEALADPLDPGFGFDAVRLEVPVADPLAPAQPGLDGNRAEDALLDELVDRLVARLGRDRVLRFQPRDTHDPARAVRHVRAVDGSPSADWPAPEPDAPPTRPLRLFRAPQPVDTMAEVPDGPPRRFRWRRTLHDVTRAEGPERIEPEWWRVGPDTPPRDYYRVEDAAGHRFWLFREGHYGAATPPRWYLHGLFA